MNILITNHHLINYAGSELHTFDLCTALKNMGHKVIVATFFYDSPMRNLFFKQDIPVINFLNPENDDFSNIGFDLIIAHHFPLLTEILLERKITCKKLICHSLSPIIHLEEFISFNQDYCVYSVHSERNKLNMQEKGFKDVHVFPNSVPSYYFSFNSPKIKRKNKSITIVSNHLCEEIREAIRILRKKKVNVKVYGMGYKFDYVTPEKLIEHDAIVTIGRTVQYGLALGIPVYCYDHFGGAGWITPDNVEIESQFNFSGRNHKTKKFPDTIAMEILNGSLKTDLKALRDFSIANFNLEENLKCLIEKTTEKLDFNLDKALENKASIHNFSNLYKEVLRKKHGSIRFNRLLNLLRKLYYKIEKRGYLCN